MVIDSVEHHPVDQAIASVDIHIMRLVGVPCLADVFDEVVVLAAAEDPADEDVAGEVLYRHYDARKPDEKMAVRR